MLSPAPIRRHSLRLGLIACALSAAACAVPPPTLVPPGLQSPFTGYSSQRYRDDRMWLCRPDLPSDRCRADLSATDLRADGSRAVERHTPAAAPKVDCFYVYPTVDAGLLPGNDTDFGDLPAITQMARDQAARFSEVCSVYAPLYRQITIGTYAASREQRQRRMEVAFSDVEDAFLHYMGRYNHGRKVALIGHSQGADMIVRLLQRRFDVDPVMRDRLLVAMPIGMQLEVPRGQRSGGTFASLPVCARPDEIGCIVAYRSYRAGAPPAAGMGLTAPKPGHQAVCVNPAGAGGDGPARLSRSYLATTGYLGAALVGAEGISTPFVVLRDFYSATCVEQPDGFGYLAISATPARGDRRVSPIDMQSSRFNTSFGLHVLDLQLPLGDLIDLVARKAGATP